MFLLHFQIVAGCVWLSSLAAYKPSICSNPRVVCSKLKMLIWVQLWWCLNKAIRWKKDCHWWVFCALTRTWNCCGEVGLFLEMCWNSVHLLQIWFYYSDQAIATPSPVYPTELLEEQRTSLCYLNCVQPWEFLLSKLLKGLQSEVLYHL